MDEMCANGAFVPSHPSVATSRTVMILRLLGPCILIAASGCALHQPLQVCGSGNVKVKADVSALPIKAEGRLCEMPVIGGVSGAGKIALIDVDGVLLNVNHVGLLSSGENPVDLFREKLDYVRRHNFRAVVVRINSPGGGATASDIMRRDLSAFRAATGIPVVVCCMDVAAGGAYYLATESDVIFAHPTTIIGGFGVIYNMYNLREIPRHGQHPTDSDQGRRLRRFRVAAHQCSRRLSRRRDW